jgi:hypothetical protein
MTSSSRTHIASVADTEIVISSIEESSDENGVQVLALLRTKQRPMGSNEYFFHLDFPAGKHVSDEIVCSRTLTPDLFCEPSSKDEPYTQQILD